MADKPPEGTRTFHYVITLQWASAGRIATLGGHGTLYLHPQATRTEVLAHLLRKLGTPEGCTGPGMILCFELAPDELSEAAAAVEPALAEAR